ncbi:MAG: DUF4157 domain-containing protein [Bacteroidota bacterium]
MDSSKISRSRQQPSAGALLNSGDKAAKGYPAIIRFAQAPTGGSNNRLPHQLQQGVEALSGMSMAGTSVHYNSPAPAQIGALAYAAGTQIHLGPGQEQHLPHEAWHIVQQKQGRVKPTLQAKGLAINDDHALETEADVMGQRAAQLKTTGNLPPTQLNTPGLFTGDVVQRKIGFEFQAYNSIFFKGLDGELVYGKGAGFEITNDTGAILFKPELEIKTMALDETEAGRNELEDIMQAMELFLKEVVHGRKIKEIKSIEWPSYSADTEFEIPETKHFHPQATVGVKFEKIGELIDYITQAPYKSGGATVEEKKWDLADTPALTEIKAEPPLSTPGASKVELKAETAPHVVEEKKRDERKAAEPAKFGWSGQDDQQAFKKAWAEGFRIANSKIPAQYPKTIGFAAIIQGLIQNIKIDKKALPNNGSLLKYWMPFMLRTGFLSFYKTVEKPEELEKMDDLDIDIVHKDVGDTTIQAEGGEKTKMTITARGLLTELKSGKDPFQEWNVQGHGQIKGPKESPEEKDKQTENLDDWNMDFIEDIGTADTERDKHKKRRGAIIELRKLGNDLPPEELKNYALAVFDLIRLINVPDPPRPAPPLPRGPRPQVHRAQ